MYGTSHTMLQQYHQCTAQATTPPRPNGRGGLMVCPQWLPGVTCRDDPEKSSEIVVMNEQVVGIAHTTLGQSDCSIWFYSRHQNIIPVS